MNIFERLGRLDRRWIFLLLAAVCIVTLLVSFRMPVRVSREVRAIYAFVDSLQAGEVIHVSLDYDPNTLAELHPMAYAIMEQALERRAGIVLTALSQNGAAMVEQVMRDVIDTMKVRYDMNVQYGRDIVFLGYKPYFSIVILGMGENYRIPFPTDYYNTKLDSIPMMKSIQNYYQVKAVIVIGSGNIIDAWIADANARYGVRLALGLTGVVAADYYPYLRSGQIFGLMGGMLGAAEYERLVDKPGDASEAMRVQVSAHAVIILFILFGNIGYFISRRKGGPTV
jgi:hypothetical protein